MTLLAHDVSVRAGLIPLSLGSVPVPAYDADLHQAKSLPGSPALTSSDVVATLAHELRTPLASLYATLEVLGSAPEEHTAEVSPWLQHLKRNVIWLQDMVENATTWSQLESGRLSIQPQPVSLLEVATQAAELVHPLLQKKRQQVHVPWVPAVPAVLADARHLTQVFVNLLTNAGAYGPQGDVIVVSVEAQDGWVVARVSDHGPGITTAEQHYLFERYRRGTAATMRPGGMGLGLHIVKALVETYGGQVGVDSEPGRGATFWIKLQPAPEDAPVPPADSHNSTPTTY